MIVWAFVLLMIAISLLSGDFARVTEDFFTNHAVAILLVALGMLYWTLQRNKKSNK